LEGGGQRMEGCAFKVRFRMERHEVIFERTYLRTFRYFFEIIL
jgi:hypothetical protein